MKNYFPSVTIVANPFQTKNVSENMFYQSMRARVSNVTNVTKPTHKSQDSVGIKEKFIKASPSNVKHVTSNSKR